MIIILKMKKIIYLFSFIAFFTILISSSYVLAATEPAKNNAVTTGNPKNVPVATVNIEKAVITSQKDNVFNISFNITNREIVQNGVKYGVKLMTEGQNKEQYIVDEKVYDETLTLAENSTLTKNISYSAPNNISGKYTLVLFSSNTSGFPFAISYIKDVTLSSTVKGLEIVTNSCYLKVEGDTTNTHYNLLDNVDIGKDENLRLNCNVINNSNDAHTCIRNKIPLCVWNSSADKWW
jgi:hypothetical protein